MDDVQTVYTHCRTCLMSCGVKVAVKDGQVQSISPDKENPHTWRDFCAKGRTGNALVSHPRRIRVPMRREGDRYVEASWEEAISDIAGRLRAIIDEHGPQAVGGFWGNPAPESATNAMFFGGLLDAIGTNQRYWCGSVDQNNYHVVSEALYGTRMMVTVPDVDDCDYFLLVGMNPAESGMFWLEIVPNGWRRVQDRVAAGAELIVVDPRRTATAAKATTHLAVRPGEDWALLLGMLKVIFERGWEHTEDCATLNGLPELKALAAEADMADLSARCDIPVAQIRDIAEQFATARTAVCISHTGVSQHVTGTIGEYLSHALNLVTGRVDRPGGRRFERGYVDTIKLFGVLAPTRDFTSRVRGLAAVGGHQAMAELPDEIMTPGHGQIRAMLIDAGNPVVTGPDGRALDEALESLELLVAIDLLQRESHRHAHWLIPGTHWLERAELQQVFTAGWTDQPFAQYANQAVPPPPGVLNEWEFLTELALAMKVPLFGKPGVNTFIKATRLLAKITRRPKVAFDPEWLSRLLVASGRRIKWKDLKAAPHGLIYGEKEFGHFANALCTPDKRVQIAPPEFILEIRRQLANRPVSNDEYPFQLISCRTKNFMNSHSADLSELNRSESGNEVEINPDDAARLGIQAGDPVRVTSCVGSIMLPAILTTDVRAGVVMIPFGFGSRVFDFEGAQQPIVYGINRNLLNSNIDLDPLSKISPLNGQAVRVELASQRDPAAAPGEAPACPRQQRSAGI